MNIVSIGKVYRLSTSQKIPINLKEAWSFFSSPKNLQAITPKKLKFTILSGADRAIYPGQVIQYKVSPFLFYTAIWVTEITHVKEEEYFVDEQRYGPYEFWHHKHFFKAIPGGVELQDVVDFKVPFGWLGRKLTKGFIERELQQVFTYRNNKLTELFGAFKS